MVNKMNWLLITLLNPVFLLYNEKYSLEISEGSHGAFFSENRYAVRGTPFNRRVRGSIPLSPNGD
jgi:hypothetical protein